MGKFKGNSVLLLTACVNPKGMAFTELQNADIRYSQYIEAIKYYVNETNFPIVVVENTNTVLYSGFQREIHMGRMEFLLFDGNRFDLSLGKGYGEGEILRFAFAHSKLLEKYEFVIKITGRHKVLIINSIISVSQFFSGRSCETIVCDILPRWKVAVSDFFIASHPFFVDFLNNSSLKIQYTA